MKRCLCILATVLLLSGCQKEDISETSYSSDKPQNITSENTQKCTIKWCLTECGLEDDVIEQLNDALAEDGCKYDVELVEIERNFEKTYEEQVREYEKSFGSLDVVSTGYGFSNNIGAGYEFIKSSYFTPLDNLSDYTAVPEKLWDTVKVDGMIYTVPGLNFNDSGITFYFNRAYISDRQIAEFNGDLEKLGDMLNGLTANKKFAPIFYELDYTDPAKSFSYSAKGGLLLDNVSHKAVNPYKFNEFVEYARTLNRFYHAELFGTGINFERYDYPAEKPPEDFAVMVSLVKNSEENLADIGYGSFDLAAYSLPFYLENRVLYSMGVAANSEHKEQSLDFLKRLYSDNKYAKILLQKTGVDTMAVSISADEVKGNYENAVVSDFAGFELVQKEIDTELREMLISSFDRLCKSEDFDRTLTEINEELDRAGIDAYTANVNKLLEESNASSDQ